MFGRDRTKITGRVIASKPAGQHGDTPGFAITRWKYVIEYTVPGGETKRVELKQAMGLNSMKMKNPRVGATVPLLLGRLGGVEFDVEDPRIAIDPNPEKAARAKQKDDYKHALKTHDDARGATTSKPSSGSDGHHRDQLEHGSVHARPPSSSRPEPASVEQRLAKLQQLNAGGLLTAEEYAAQRQRILDSL